MNRQHNWQSGLLPELVLHGSTTKAFGVFREGRGVPQDKVLANSKEFAQSIGVPLEQFAAVHQVHGNRVLIVDESLPRDQWWEKNEADALVTHMPGVLLLIKTADCVPVFFYDPLKKAVGIAHAGWKGIVADVVGNTIKTMIETYGCKPANLMVAIGPAICANHYDVTDAKDDRLKQYETLFGASTPVIVRKNGRVALNLPAAVKVLCVRQGVKPGQIELSGVCTYEQPQLWASFRREGAQLTHDIWSFILLQ